MVRLLIGPHREGTEAPNSVNSHCEPVHIFQLNVVFWHKMTKKCEFSEMLAGLTQSIRQTGYRQVNNKTP